MSWTTIFPVLTDLARTEHMDQLGLGFWRVLVWGEKPNAGKMNYRPIIGCQMGCARAWPTRQLMKALI
jgi:hypothetical protein